MSDQEINSLTGVATNVPQLAGRTLGKYQLVRKLGRGGMGEVWLARDTVAKIDVALKFLPAELQNSEEAQEQLSESYRKVHGLHHPHICTVKDLVLDPVVGYFLVMDYFEGVTLSRYRKEYERQNGSFPVKELVRILTPAADALDYAHSQGLLHRDIKPGNILISADGSRVRVIDFQLATEVRSTLSRYTNAKFDTSGTYPYMAPEQFRGAHATPATDQYSLAMTAYELLAGHLPFETLGWDMWKGIITDPQTTLPEIPGLSSPAQRALMRALSLDSKQRATSCKAFVGMLTQLEPPPLMRPGESQRPIAAGSSSNNSAPRSGDSNTKGASPPRRSEAISSPGQRVKQSLIACVFGLVLVAITSYFVYSISRQAEGLDVTTPNIEWRWKKAAETFPPARKPQHDTYRAPSGY